LLACTSHGRSPTAPLYVVKRAAGFTPMKLRHFAAVPAIGIIPKIALTDLAGNSIVQALKGGGHRHIVMLVVAVAVWVIAGLIARAWLKKREAAE